MAGSLSLANGLIVRDSIGPAPSAAATRIELSIYNPADWPQVAPYWAELEQISPYSSFYLSVEWTAAWLEIFGDLLQPQLLLFKSGTEAVGACLLVRSTERRGPFRIKRIYLNTGGGNPAERTLMEFNSLLCRTGWEHAVAEALAAHLRQLEWDEFAIDGIFPSPALAAIQSRALPLLNAEISFMPSFYVDLDQLRREGSTYEKYLSANTREQLRRSLKLYAKIGPVRTEVAPDLQTAEMFFEELCHMHQARWTKRGETGAFGPGRRLEFHRTLIRMSFPERRIQLLRVSAGDRTIGVLYNFVHGGKVYFFQSGFHYEAEKHLKPGLVTHACAIQHCLEAGYHDYDLLAGDARYKRSLAKSCRQLAWVVFARPSLKVKLIDALRTVKRRARKLRKK